MLLGFDVSMTCRDRAHRQNSTLRTTVWISLTCRVSLSTKPAIYIDKNDEKYIDDVNGL